MEWEDETKCNNEKQDRKKRQKGKISKAINSFLVDEQCCPRLVLRVACGDSGCLVCVTRVCVFYGGARCIFKAGRKDGI